MTFIPLLNHQQTRDMDAEAILKRGEPLSLIKGAAKALCLEVCRLIEQNKFSKKIMILSGKGNNGSDSLALALLLKQSGYLPQVLLCEPQESLNESCALCLAEWLQEGGVVHTVQDASEVQQEMLQFEGQVVVDGLLGSGFKPPLKEYYKQVIRAVNRASKMVVSIDIPSGLSGDGVGHILPEVAIVADMTLTLGSLKPVFLKSSYAPWFGKVLALKIGFCETELSAWSLHPRVFEYQDGVNLLKARPRHWHKGLSGRILTVGGSQGMEGALFLSALGASRGGGGLVSMLWLSEHLSFRQAKPEWMQLEFAQCQNTAFRKKLFGKVSSVVIGPGLGQEGRSLEALEWIREVDVPMVLDADALNIMAHQYIDKKILKNAILTPHVGEASRLLSEEKEKVEDDLVWAAKALSQKFTCTVVLKSFHTVVCQGEEVRVHVTGSPAMASGGMGDVLSGLLGAFLASGYDSFTSANLAVWVHGLAGEACLVSLGVLASEVADLIPGVMTDILKHKKRRDGSHATFYTI